jgi:hypothetical protein
MQTHNDPEAFHAGNYTEIVTTNKKALNVGPSTVDYIWEKI